MYQTGWNLILFFTLILSFENSVSNEWTTLPQKEKKVVTCSKAFSNDCDMIHSQSQQYHCVKYGHLT